MSTYSTNLALELIGTGEQAGVWGTTTNTNLGTLIEQSISGYVTQAVATGTDTTITIPNGSSGVARNMYIELTGTGGASTNLIVPANKKLYFIFNNSTGDVTVKVSGQTGVSVPTGKKMVLVSNGTDIVNGLNYIADFASNSATITHLSATSASITNLTLTSLVISNLSIASANITTLTGSTQTLSGNLTLNGGTANGVLYLNGSKVATSGTALTFDGTNLGVGGSGDPFGRFYGRSVGISSASSAFLEINAATGSSSGIDFGVNAARTAGITSNTTETNFTTLGATPILFGINGTEGMRLTSTGLGIGTSSPGAKLDVSAGSAAAQITSTTTSAGAIPKLTFSHAGNDAFSIVGGTYMAWLSSGTTERMRLDSSGNLGIGTSSPAAKLHVVGDSLSNTFKLIANTAVSGSDATIFRPADNTMAFSTNGSERARIDSSGNLGLGVTPSAWADFKVLQITQAAILGYPGQTHYTQNVFWDGSNWKYISTSEASRYQQSNGIHSWHTAPSGTAGNTISFTQAMTLDASGQLLLGGTSLDNPQSWGRIAQVINSGSNGAAISVKDANNEFNIATYSSALIIADGLTERARIDSSGNLDLGTTGGSDRYQNIIATSAKLTFNAGTGFTGSAATSIYNQSAIAMVFGTNNTERARITSGGAFSVNTTSAGAQMNMYHNGAVTAGFVIRNTDTGAASQNAILFERNTSIVGVITTTNTATAYVTSSDRRLKENIVSADEAGSVIDAIEIVKHDWKVGGHTRYGMIAQDLHSVAPEAVFAGDDGEELEKAWGVDYSKLVPMLVKEIQSLRARVAQLESK